MKTLDEELYRVLIRAGDWDQLAPHRHEEYEVAARRIRAVPEPKTLGQVAMEAWYEAMDSSASYTWDRVQPSCRTAWEAVACAVLESQDK